VPFAVLAAAALPVVPAGTDWRQTRAAAAAARKAELERVADYYERQERTG
jgi:type II secretory pathway pseudopilin PulG